MQVTAEDRNAAIQLQQLAGKAGINIENGKIMRTSSRFCFGVEHGDYNGTELFGIGTDRFIWIAYRPNDDGKIRLFSGNFPQDGVVEFDIGDVPQPQSPQIADSWARFPFGVDFILRREGLKLKRGIDAVIYGNIPGGGLSRSASLTINLILCLLDVNGIRIEDKFKIVDWAQAVENDYIGSPCGKLDQTMILFARANAGTYYNPKDRCIKYIQLGENARDFRIVILDTGTLRPGLEKSTYKIRRCECEQFVTILQNNGYDITSLADIREQRVYEQIINRFRKQYPDLCSRLKYIFSAQSRFRPMLDAFEKGDIETVGSVFRADGIGLRDDYKISGPELEAMCDIARSVDGVLGERMLGGGDKGASGAIVLAGSVEKLKKAIDSEYPCRCPEYAGKYAVHICNSVDGVACYNDLLS